MHFFDKKYLQSLVCDQEIFPLFNLMEREKQILRARLDRGYTYKFIGGLLKITPQRSQALYKRAVEKMKTQILEILRNYKKNNQKK